MIYLNKKSRQEQAGFSNLLLVLILAALLALLMAPMMFIANFQARQANSSLQSQKAYFEAEGALLATLKLVQDFNTPGSTYSGALATNSGQPGFGAGGAGGYYGFGAGGAGGYAGYSNGTLADGIETFQVGDTTITREISTDPTTGVKLIAVTADTNGYKRKLVAEFKQSQTSVPAASIEGNLDLALVLDRSGSMDQADKFPKAVEAAIALTNKIEESTATSQISTWFFHDVVGTYPFNQELTQDYNLVRDKLSRAQTGSGTNVLDGLYHGRKELSSPRTQAEGEARKVMILLSDGRANHYASDSECQQDYPYYVNLVPPNVLRNAEDILIACEAHKAAEKGIIIHTIGLGERTKIPEEMLKYIANVTGGNYFYAESPDQLSEIFVDSIGSSITNVEFLAIKEVVPE